MIHQGDEEIVMCKSFVAGLALLVLVSTQAGAQNPAQPVQPGTQPQRAVGTPGATPGVQAGGMTTVDHAIAACLALGNQEEVALAQFAQDHAKSKEVKEFAKLMSDDHKAALQKLRQIAPQVASVGENLQAGNERQDSITSNAATGLQAGTVGAQPGAQIAGPDGALFSQMLSLQQRVAQECLTLTQDELTKSEDFDRCYIGQQVGAHIGMLAKLKGSAQFASPQLRSFIDEATKTVEKHLDKAKQIAKSLEDESRSGSTRAANRAEDSRR